MKGRAPIWLGAVLLALLLAPRADAADSVYWANPPGGKISFAALDGSGGADLSTFGSVVSPNGPSFDIPAGRIYWANFNDSKISFANVDGSGGSGDLNTGAAPINGPAGTVIDLAAGRIYWANANVPKISFANLDGSGGGELNTTGATVQGAIGVAVDPATGRIYWANATANTISFANLDGSGGGPLDTTGAIVTNPRGVAIDPVGARIYWANNSGGVRIASAALSGGAGSNLNTNGTTAGNPLGVAIDPAARRVYWASNANKISFADLGGSGGSDLKTMGATTFGPGYPALLQAPSGIGAPSVTGGPGVGQILACSQGTWAADQPAALLYRAPASFSYSWSKDGIQLAPIAPASIGAGSVAEYRCTVTAHNFAGSTSQTSAPFGVFAIGRAKVNKKKGTAVFPVTVPGAGVVTLRGKSVVKQRSAARRSGAVAKTVGKAGVVKLKVRAKGKTKKKLRRKGRAKVKVKIGFVPTGGNGGTKTKTVTLKKS